MRMFHSLKKRKSFIKDLEKSSKKFGEAKKVLTAVFSNSLISEDLSFGLIFIYDWFCKVIWKF
jgi:hypothetical protein